MRFRLISLILLISAAAHGQIDTLRRGDQFIRFNPTGIFDLLDLNISVGAERRFADDWSIALDAAFIPYSMQFESAKRSRGFIVRPAVRYYMNGSSFYVEAEYHYKQVTHKIEDWIDRGVANGAGAYQQYTQFRYRKQASGGHLKVGRIYSISANNRLWLELYLGIGIHKIRYRLVKEPGSHYMHVNAFNQVVTDDAFMRPAVPAGLRLMYRLANNR